MCFWMGVENPFWKFNKQGEFNKSSKINTGITQKISETNSSFHVKVHNWKSLISIFQEFSSSINETFILARRLGTGLCIYDALGVSSYFLISKDPKSHIVGQLVYTMFISNNRTSFYLWWKVNLVKH